MNVEKLNHWLMLAANIGVIGGIVFLAYEIRQNTSQMRTESSYAITEIVNVQNANRYTDPELTDLILRGNEDFHSLNPNEKSRYQQYQFSRLNIADYILFLETEGLTDLQFRYVEWTVRELHENPGAMQWWATVADGWVGSDQLFELMSSSARE
jgi:hypothetical protein